MQYLDEMMDLSKQKGKPVARRTNKVYGKVEKLYQQVTICIEEEASRYRVEKG